MCTVICLLSSQSGVACLLNLGRSSTDGSVRDRLPPGQGWARVGVWGGGGGSKKFSSFYPVQKKIFSACRPKKKVTSLKDLEQSQRGPLYCSFFLYPPRPQTEKVKGTNPSGGGGIRNPRSPPAHLCSRRLIGGGGGEGEVTLSTVSIFVYCSYSHSLHFAGKSSHLNFLLKNGELSAPPFRLSKEPLDPKQSYTPWRSSQNLPRLNFSVKF